MNKVFVGGVQGANYKSPGADSCLCMSWSAPFLIYRCLSVKANCFWQHIGAVAKQPCALYAFDSMSAAALIKAHQAYGG